MLSGKKDKIVSPVCSPRGASVRACIVSGSGSSGSLRGTKAWSVLLSEVSFNGFLLLAAAGPEVKAGAEVKRSLLKQTLTKIPRDTAAGGSECSRALVIAADVILLHLSLAVVSNLSQGSSKVLKY